MDHDLQMIIYGALIGLGSSVATTLFQTWINRKEKERQHLADKIRDQQNLQIPTLEQTIAINQGAYIDEKSLTTNRYKPFLLSVKDFVLNIVTFLLLLGGFGYLLLLRTNTVLNFLISAFVTIFIINEIKNLIRYLKMR